MLIKQQWFLKPYQRLRFISLSVCACLCACSTRSPIAHVHSHGSRLPQTAVDQHAPVSPVQLGDLNGVSALIAPVEVAPDPVHRQTIRIAQRRSVQHLQRAGMHIIKKHTKSMAG